jgi:hypothetical protein
MKEASEYQRREQRCNHNNKQQQLGKSAHTMNQSLTPLNISCKALIRAIAAATSSFCFIVQATTNKTKQKQMNKIQQAK